MTNEAHIFKNCIGIREAYTHYDGPLAYPTFSQIIKSFNQRIMEKILFDNFEFELPYRLGSIRIKKRKYKKIADRKLKVDFQKTKEYGQTIFHLNLHTDGYYYRFFWKKENAVFVNKSVYSFTPARSVKRQLASILSDPNKEIDYFE
jgi:hypothetical protein